MLVPLIVFALFAPPIQADVISDPGPYTSTQDPKLENPELTSLMVVEPTAIAVSSDAGDLEQASPLSFPAATTMTTPAATAFFTAVLREGLNPPPRLILATHFLSVPSGKAALQLATTWLMPLMTPVLVPLPLSPRTLTAHRSHPLATP